MSELSCNVEGVQYKAIEENRYDSCDGCCASNDYYLCHRLLMQHYKCSGIYKCDGVIWIKAETEMTKEPQKENQPKTKHVHADMMLEYAKEAMQSETPWDAFEYKEKEDTEWQQCNMQIAWLKSTEYRKKPKTININGYKVPKPLREAPADGTKYYYPSTSVTEVLYSFYCSGDEYDNIRLEHGLVHLTREAAQLHLEALLSFTSDK